MKHLAVISVIALLILAGSIGAAAQSEIESPCSAPEINVVTTIGMIADVARNIGGGCTQVTALMGAGVDPHLYTATERDVETLFEADIVFYGGLHLEARMIDVFEQIRDGMGKPTIPVSEVIPEDLRLTSPTYNQPDPHVWMDVQLWTLAAGEIARGLIEYAPAYADYFAANLAAYTNELDALDTYAREQIARIPEQQRVLVTAHDAFQYFSRAYGIEVFAPQGITTESEVGVQNIRDMIQLLIDRQLPAIFVESSISPDVVEAIVAGAEDQGHEVVIGGLLFSDALGDEGTFEGTYIGMITHNVDTIVSGLLGDGE